MKLEFQEYQARKIVNVHRHVDSWFWDKYSAHPYVGCRSGCEFCYLRGGTYLGKRSPESFDTLIQVKTNAVELLRNELGRLPKDVIACGDWQQPAETRYQLSRNCLQVIYEHRFPLLVIERSPLVLRDIDLIEDINRKTWAAIIFSLSNIDEQLKRIFEPHSPGIKRRLAAMDILASRGIMVGAALMPIFPDIGDDDLHLADTVKAVKDHGGSFILGSGLSLAGKQAERTLQAAVRLEATLENSWRKLYTWEPGKNPQYSPPREYVARLGMKIRENCIRHNLPDRMPRYIPEGKVGINKRIAELLFLKSYDAEIVGADVQRVWAYRKAAWTVDEMPEFLSDIYQSMGQAGLRSLPNVGNTIASEISSWLEELNRLRHGENPI